MTIGIDLAAQPRETAACMIAWRRQTASLEVLAAGFSDDALLELLRRAPTKVAIDAPFGWPGPFVDAVAEYQRTGEWREADIAPLRLRDTDRAVISSTGQQPLSVSSDRIAVTAMRCARFLSRLRTEGHSISRDGRGLVAEVYPAAALRVWGFEPRGYKGPKPEQRAKRLALANGLSAATASWLTFTNAERASLAESDHLFDALICALLARAIAEGRSRKVEPEERQAALAEGWIHLPLPGSLGDLATEYSPRLSKQ